MARGDVVADSQSIANGSALVIRPPAGETWLITAWGASGMARLEMYDGANAVRLRDLSISAAFTRKRLRLFVSNTVYARIVNASGGNAVLSYSGVVFKAAGEAPGVGDAVGAIVTGVAAGAEVMVQPPADETWLITEWGAQGYNTGQGAPDIALKIGGASTVGGNTTVADFLAGSHRIFATNTVPLTIRNNSASTSIIIYSGVRTR